MNTRGNTLFESWKKFLNEASWNNSPDEDWPASDTNVKKFKSDKAVVFDSKERYGDTGADSHGRDSHMSKHWFEFSENDINVSIKKAIGLISDYQKDNEIFFLTKGSGKVQPISSISDIKNGDIVNTFDLINDKKFDQEKLLDIEKKIYAQAMSDSIKSYDREADQLMSSAVDVSDAEMQSMEKLIETLKNNSAIKFKAAYQGQEKTYYYEIKKTAIIAQLDDGSIATLFRLRNKGKPKQEDPSRSIRGFHSKSGTVPTDEYSLLRSLADSEKAKGAQQTPKPKKKKQQKKKQSPTEFVQSLINRGQSPDQIRNILSKKYPKMPQQGIDGVMKKAGI